MASSLQKVVTRRYTIASAIPLADGMEVPEQSASRRMSPEEEDILLAEIIKYFDIIENKATDRSLTPKALQERHAQAWEQIKNSFVEKTGVSVFFSFIELFLAHITKTFFFSSIGPSIALNQNGRQPKASLVGMINQCEIRSHKLVAAN